MLRSVDRSGTGVEVAARAVLRGNLNGGVAHSGALHLNERVGLGKTSVHIPRILFLVAKCAGEQ